MEGSRGSAASSDDCFLLLLQQVAYLSSQNNRQSVCVEGDCRQAISRMAATY